MCKQSTLYTALIISLAFASSASSTPLQFRHVVIDENPLQEGWGGMDDCSLADFDSDGNLDIWFSGNTDLKEGSKDAYLIEWYRNPGTDGSNWQRYTIHKGNYLGATVGDIDGDGDWDIISGRDYGTKQFVWLENTGDFNSDWPEHTIRGNMPFHPDEVHIGDLNRDGRLDLVVATFRNNLYYIPCPKDPVKGEWELYRVATSDKAHGGADLADIDGDGDRDIVWGNCWYENSGNPTDIPWNEHIIDSLWTTSSKVITGDVDGDSEMEVFLCGEESDDGIAWYKRTEDGDSESWDKHVVSSDYSHVHTLQLDDFDHDGDYDLLAAEMHQTKGQQRVTVFECLDIAQNSWKETILAETGSHNAKIGDLNNDGLPDVIGKNWGGDLKAEIWLNNTPVESPFSMKNWTYIRVDSLRVKYGDFSGPVWLKYFGLAASDMTGDGFKDIVSGRYFYRNPGGDMTGAWQRVDFGFNVDACLVVDVDGDKYADVIGEALPDIYWLEAEDAACTKWKARKVASMDATSHVNGQGFRTGQIIADGKPEIILTGGTEANEINIFQIPDNPEKGNWPRTLVTGQATDEGFGLGDMDGDGDLDICSGNIYDGSKNVAWWINPGDGSGNWAMQVVGSCVNWPDRCEMSDINDDGKLDIIVSEEWALDGCNVFWFEQPGAGPFSGEWKRHLIVNQFTTNSMDVEDMDKDGLPEVITCEHRGTEKLAIWKKVDNGRGWIENIISRSRESHLGALAVDLDNDNDLDIVSIAWDNYRNLHVWINGCDH